MFIPAVQTAIARKTSRWLNETYQVNIHIDRVKISPLLGTVSLQNLSVQDHKNDTLFYIQRLRTTILGVKNIWNGTYKLGRTRVKGLKMNMKTYRGESDTNLDIFIAKLEGDTAQVSQKPFLLAISRIYLAESAFILTDENEQTPEILNFTRVQAALAQFKVEGSNVSTFIEDLALNWKNGLSIKHLATQFRYTPSHMKFEGLCIETQGSAVNGSLAFEYRREDLADFVNKVQLNADFINTALSLDDVNYFYNGFEKGRTVVFTTHVAGTLNALRATGLNLRSGATKFAGDINLYGAFDSERLIKINANIGSLVSDYYELTAMMPRLLGNALPASLSRLGTCQVSGYVEVTPNAVDAKLNVDTALGGGYTDLSLANIAQADKVTYQGVLKCNDFEVGTLIGDADWGKTTLNLQVDGKGFTQEALNTEITGRIDHLEYRKYSYQNIQVSGLVKDQLFDGALSVDDPNFKFNFKGLADFSQEVNEFDFKAWVDYANLHQLNLVSRDSISTFKGEIAMKVKGNTLDDAVGTISFLKSNYTNQNDSYYFEDFAVTSSFQGKERLLEINSPDILTGFVKGEFSFKELRKLIRNSIGSLYTHYSPHQIATRQHVEFGGTLYNKIVEVFYPKINFGPNTSIKGNMGTEEGDFKITFRSPQIRIYENTINRVEVQIDAKNPLFNTYIQVGEVQTNFYKISDFGLINTKRKDTLLFRTEFSGGADKSDSYILNFYHTFGKNEESVVGIKPSEITFKGNKWHLNRENNTQNKVVLSASLDTISIDDIVMTHEAERMELQGKLIDSTYKNIKLQFRDVSLGKITPTIDSLSLNGVVNGGLNVLQTNGNYLPTANLSIRDFAVNNTLLGTLRATILGKDNLRRYAVNTTLTNEDVESLTLIGDVVVAKDAPSIDLQASLKNLNLEFLNVFKNEAVSNIRGAAYGNATITGSLKNPDMEGQLFLENAGLKIPYLNVDLSFTDRTRIGLNRQTFYLPNSVLADTRYSTRASFKGTVTHNQLKKWYLDFVLDTQGNKFLALNTQETEDALYYGVGFMNGTATIRGYTDRLRITVNAATGAGTNIKIPISEITSIGDASFINFIDKNEKKITSQRPGARSYEGMEMTFDLDVTPDAEAEIVIDKKSGSTLKGTGAGNLLMEVNTNRKFNMWGDFITYTGTYNFKYGGVIDKRFKVLPGGTINWEGDPYNAAINMRAVYSLYANPAVLLEKNDFTRKVATDVEIKLEGNLEQLEPDFNIKFPGISSVVNSELQYKLEEKNKRQLQALSLLSQGAFVSEVSISQQAISGNLFETASGIVNEILNDEDGKFDVGISLEKGGRNPNAEAQIEDRLGVTISTQINERILVNGKIGVPVGGITETVVAGDVEVQILLNEDGSLSAKIFNKENEIQQFLADRLGYTQGVGLSYQVEFDTLRELFQKIFKKRRENPSKKEPPQTNNEGILFSNKKQRR